MKRWIMSHNSRLIWPNFDIQLLNHLTSPHLNSISLYTFCEKPWFVSHNSWLILPLFFLAEDTTLYEGMNHDSCLMSHPTSNTDSQLSNHIAHPSFTPFHNLRYSKKPWIMIHDSWVIPPLILTHNSWIILFIPLLLHFTIYIAVRSPESWFMTHESSHL